MARAQGAAMKSGLLSIGSTILEVDCNKIAALTVSQVQDLIVGTPGSKYVMFECVTRTKLVSVKGSG